jgi:hypothetical protein
MQIHIQLVICCAARLRVWRAVLIRHAHDRGRPGTVSSHSFASKLWRRGFSGMARGPRRVRSHVGRTRACILIAAWSRRRCDSMGLRGAPQQHSSRQCRSSPADWRRRMICAIPEEMVMTSAWTGSVVRTRWMSRRRNWPVHSRSAPVYMAFNTRTPEIVLGATMSPLTASSDRHRPCFRRPPRPRTTVVADADFSRHPSSDFDFERRRTDHRASGYGVLHWYCKAEPWPGP